MRNFTHSQMRRPGLSAVARGVAILIMMVGGMALGQTAGPVHALMLGTNQVAVTNGFFLANYTNGLLSALVAGNDFALRTNVDAQVKTATNTLAAAVTTQINGTNALLVALNGAGTNAVAGWLAAATNTLAGSLVGQIAGSNYVFSGTALLQLTNATGSGVIADPLGNVFLSKLDAVNLSRLDFERGTISYGATNAGSHLVATDTNALRMTFGLGVMTIWSANNTTPGQVLDGLLSKNVTFSPETDGYAVKGVARFLFADGTTQLSSSTNGTVTVPVLNTSSNALVTQITASGTVAATLNTVSSNSLVAQITVSSNGAASLSTVSSNALMTLATVSSNALSTLTTVSSNSLLTQITLSSNGVALYDGTNYASLFGGQVWALAGRAPAAGMTVAAPGSFGIIGPPNFGCANGELSLEGVNTNHPWRFPGDGDVTGLGFYASSTQGLSAVYGEVWRRAGTNYDLVGRSPALWPITAASSNYFDISATPITGVREGDFTGFRLEYAAAGGATAASCFATNAAGDYGSQQPTNAAGTLLLTNCVAAVSGTSWNTGAVCVVSWPMQFYMARPVMLFDGYSIISGSAVTRGFWDVGPGEDPASSMPTQVRIAEGVTGWNIAMGGENWGHWTTVGKSNVIQRIHPQLAFNALTINSLNTGATVQSILQAHTNFVRGCLASGITPVIAIDTPFGNYVSASGVIASNWNWIGDRTLEMRATFPGFIVADPRSRMGVTFTRDGITVVNGALAPEMDSGDAIHPNAYGQRILAQVVLAAITAQRVRGEMEVGNLKVNGWLRFSGAIATGIRVLAAEQYNSPGSNFWVHGSDAYKGGANLAGGDLWFESGLSTGTNVSGVQIRVSPPSFSGTQYSTNVLAARWWQDSIQAAQGLYGVAGKYNSLLFFTNDASGIARYQNGLIVSLINQFGFAPHSSSASIILGLDASDHPFAYPDFYIGGGSAVEKLTVSAASGPAYIRLGASGTNSGFYIVDGTTKFGLIYAQTNNTFQFTYGSKEGVVASMDGIGNFTMPGMTAIRITNNTIWAATANIASLNVTNATQLLGSLTGTNATFTGAVGIGTSGISPAAYETLVVDAGGGLNRIRMNAVGTNTQLEFCDNGVFKGAFGYDAGRGLPAVFGSGGSANIWFDNAGSLYTSGLIQAGNALTACNGVVITNYANIYGTALVASNLTVNGSTITFGGTSAGNLFTWNRPPSGSGLMNRIQLDTDPANVIEWSRDTLGMVYAARRGHHFMMNPEQDNQSGFFVWASTNNTAVITGTDGKVTNAVLAISFTPDFLGTNYGSWTIKTNLSVGGWSLFSGAATNSAGLTTAGGRFLGETVTNGNYTVTAADGQVVESATTNSTVTLPYISAVYGQIVSIYNEGSATATVSTGNTNAIGGFTSSTNLTFGHSITLLARAGGTNWMIRSSY